MNWQQHLLSMAREDALSAASILQNSNNSPSDVDLEDVCRFLDDALANANEAHSIQLRTSQGLTP